MWRSNLPENLSPLSVFYYNSDISTEKYGYFGLIYTEAPVFICLKKLPAGGAI